MPLQATSGAASYDAFGGGVPVVPAYIEEVFSTYLYTGNGSTQTITNGIDLSTKGGLAWLKMRNFNQGHILFDTIRGVENYLQSASSDEQYNLANSLTAFNTTGFSVGSAASVNTEPYVSWSFSKQPKFFDMVSWTGSGSNRTIAHSLGSVPACIMVKRTDVAADWQVYHRSLANTEYLVLNSTAAKATGATRWNSTSPTSTVFSLGTSTTVNASGGTYVAYLFAHDAGGFGLTGTDNVISCGSFTTDASSIATVNLGYEPQWVMFKCTSTTDNWRIVDNMRGFANAGSSSDARLFPNLSSQEFFSDTANPTATGFVTQGDLQASQTYIYIAIRRGPMAVPTLGTSVFSPVAQTNTGSQPFSVTAGFPVDSAWFGQRNGWGVNFITSDRLRGATNLLLTTATTSESFNNSTYGPSVSRLDSNTLFRDGMTNASEPNIYWMFRRAPSFFDEVCYIGDGTYGAANHNLGKTPELVIYKSRSNSVNWGVIKPVSSIAYYAGLLNLTDTFDYYSNDPSVAGLYTSTQFAKYQDTAGYTYVAYLFATAPGVSKVGTYTGNGSTQTIDCGFGSGGARFVLIRRTDSTGGWYVYDTARGMTVLTDPYLFLNTTGAEVATLGSVTTVSTGFALNSTILAAINVSGANYIFLAIA